MTDNADESPEQGPWPPGYGAANKIITREMAAHALARLREKAKDLAGGDPDDDPIERERRLQFLREIGHLPPRKSK